MMKAILLTATLIGLVVAVVAGGETPKPNEPPPAQTEVATFAGGCFWCMEPPFEKLSGVVDVVSGYSGGTRPNPTYDQVSSGATRHVESVQVHFDPSRVSYETLLEVFWRQIDPTDAGGQFVDRGPQYRSLVFVHDDAQHASAETSKKALTASGRFTKPIVTEITPFRAFYPAEDYHQDYYRNRPIRYRFYRNGSGRDRFLNRIWKDVPPVEPTTSQWSRPDEAALRARLTDEQWAVTQEDATERPFKNAYWDHHDDGIYVDVVSGEPLFSSRDKFDSGTGWPSFARPLESRYVVERTDRSLFMSRTEVRSRHGGSHLGHVFKDGPQPTGLRYCINSAALRFVPKERLADEDYGEYARLFPGD